MHQLADLGKIEPGGGEQFAEPGERPLGRVVRRRQAFVQPHRGAGAVDQHQVGEGAADVEPDAVTRRHEPARDHLVTGRSCSTPSTRIASTRSLKKHR